jgi:AcrR family transcriptional regulator
VNAQVKSNPEDTRARIMETAEALFRRLGFAKTAVADIAAELKMSPANVYRFFASKNAIIEAICRRCLSEVEGKAWVAARSKGLAGERLERMVLEILAYHKENLLIEHRVNEIVLFAMDHMWDTIRAHKEVMRNATELILRDGIASGEFEAVEPGETADLIMRSLLCFTHPVLVGQCLEEGHDVEAEAQASVRFLLRAITPRR